MMLRSDCEIRSSTKLELRSEGEKKKREEDVKRTGRGGGNGLRLPLLGLVGGLGGLGGLGGGLALSLRHVGGGGGVARLVAMKKATARPSGTICSPRGRCRPLRDSCTSVKFRMPNGPAKHTHSQSAL